MKLPYFKIQDAFNEVRDSFSSGTGTEKLTSTAKLVGKTMANVGMVVAETGWEAAKNGHETSAQQLKQRLKKDSHLLSSEQIERANAAITKSDEARDRRLQKERAEREDAKNAKKAE